MFARKALLMLGLLYQPFLVIFFSKIGSHELFAQGWL
jgi:hypothetical protein